MNNKSSMWIEDLNKKTNNRAAGGQHRISSWPQASYLGHRKHTL